MSEVRGQPRSYAFDTNLQPRLESTSHPGSCSSSSNGSAGSWDHAESSSAPTSDSETAAKWRAQSNMPEAERTQYRPHAAADDAADPSIWNVSSSSVPSQPSANRPQQQQQQQQQQAYHFSPPHSTGSSSPPDRTYLPDMPSGPTQSNYSRMPMAPQAQPQALGLNGLSPHVEPFNPGHANKPFPPPASYARLINPRSDFVAQLGEKRSTASLGHDGSYDSHGMGYGGDHQPASDPYGQHPQQQQQAPPQQPAQPAVGSNRELQPTLSQTGTEEISTIFVVGFPDDVQEREFQNMFIFSPGFEAATLKTPSSNPRDRESSQAGRPTAMLNGFPYGASNDHDMGDDNAPSTARKQIIGFAKFRTRAEAIDARNVLSGRKVDAEKGSVLKAEMAKKNLHTKRGLANDAVSGVGNPAGNASLQSLPALLAGMLQSQPHAVTSLLRHGEAEQARLSSQQNAAFDAFHSVPGPSPNAYAYPSASASPAIGGPPARMPQQMSAPPPSAAQSQPQQHQPQPGPPPMRPDFGAIRGDYHQHRAVAMATSAAQGDPHARGRSPPRGQVDAVDPNYTPPFAKSLMQQLDADLDDDVLPPMQSAPSGYGPSHYAAENARRTAASYGLPPASSGGHPQQGTPQSSYYGSPPPPSHQQSQQSQQHHHHHQQQPSLSERGPVSSDESDSVRERVGGLSLNIQAASAPSSHGVPSPSGAMSPTFPRTQNPADQNPPINTLYVGGLPAVLPSLSGPLSAAHLEECLRNAFSRCGGFRRLCFRQKSNGPMCFVEFEDVHFASRALSEMYGHTLNGLVKGGIRLSFSKNPLGVIAQRTGSMSNGSGPLSPGSMSAFLPPPEGPYPLGMSTSPTPPSLAGPTRRPSDASYTSMGSGHSAPRSMTPRSAVSPGPTAPASLHGGGSAFSPFGYGGSFNNSAISESY